MICAWPGVEGEAAARAVRRLNPDLADNAVVAVAFIPFDPHILSEDHLRQALFGTLAEGLRLLRSIDPLKPNLVLLAVGIEDGYRIAIGNPDHAPGKRFGMNRARQENEKEKAHQNRFGSRPSCTAQYSSTIQPMIGRKLSSCHQPL